MKVKPRDRVLGLADDIPCVDLKCDEGSMSNVCNKGNKGIKVLVLNSIRSD